MDTEQLIAHLSERLVPTVGNTVMRLLAVGLVLGVMVAATVLKLMLHLRPDLMIAITSSSFWVKFLYTVALAGLGLRMVERQSRAGADASVPTWLLLAPVLVLACLAVAQLSAPGADIYELVMGRTARVCSSLILLLALPIFFFLLWTMRKLAPTRLTPAGAAAGTLAGAASATLYGFHCPENAAPFVLIWYTLGVGVAAAFGAVVGRWALRW
jgi:hypothetical protein